MIWHSRKDQGRGNPEIVIRVTHEHVLSSTSTLKSDDWSHYPTALESTQHLVIMVALQKSRSRIKNVSYFVTSGWLRYRIKQFCWTKTSSLCINYVESIYHWWLPMLIKQKELTLHCNVIRPDGWVVCKMNLQYFMRENPETIEYK